jgi:phosphoribosylanthranilate isomerase
MFRIKICGITSVDDALAVARAGADAIGLNFYPGSPRCITPEAARDIVQALPAGIVKVGLFVNAPVDEVCRRFDELRLDLIQLHGDESPEFVAQLGDRPVMRAFRVGPEGIGPVAEYLARCCQLAAPPKLVLLDSLVAGQFGGTGKTANWSAAQSYVRESGLPPLVLAGGLRPENVAVAIQTVQPAAVDVAGGVEATPGHKDHASVTSFVQAARTAFANV